LVSEGNRHFKVIGDFLLDFEGISIKVYFGSEETVRIPNTIERLDAECFYGNKTISTVLFESDSKLSSIGESAFWNCSSLSSIWIPSSLQAILRDYGALVKGRTVVSGVVEGDSVVNSGDLVGATL
jgi:hypothetical protein